MTPNTRSRDKKTPNARGRPRKFADPSRPVTITLPERTLRHLADVDPDRAKAIVKIIDAFSAEAWPDHRRVTLASVDEKSALIVIGPSARLKTIPWLRLIEITPTRYLLALPAGTPPEKLEVELGDIIDNLPENDGYERALLEDLRKQVRHHRRTDKMSKLEIILVEK